MLSLMCVSCLWKKANIVVLSASLVNFEGQNILEALYLLIWIAGFSLRV